MRQSARGGSTSRSPCLQQRGWRPNNISTPPEATYTGVSRPFLWGTVISTAGHGAAAVTPSLRKCFLSLLLLRLTQLLVLRHLCTSSNCCQDEHREMHPSNHLPVSRRQLRRLPPRRPRCRHHLSRGIRNAARPSVTGLPFCWLVLMLMVWLKSIRQALGPVPAVTKAHGKHVTFRSLIKGGKSRRFTEKEGWLDCKTGGRCEEHKSEHASSWLTTKLLLEDT